jgi:hypothetical protein
MKQFKILLGTSILASSLIVGTAYAGASSSVNYPAVQTNGSFSCTVNGAGKNGTVNIDTSNINAQGFCAGGKYVTSPGHIAGFPVSSNNGSPAVNNVYFSVNNSTPWRSGSVTVTVNGKGSITCVNGNGSGRSQYMPGGGYCLAAPATQK